MRISGRRVTELKREHDNAVLSAAESMGGRRRRRRSCEAEARLKAFESERLKLQCEQAFATSRQAQVDAEAKGEKLEVLKS